jgi:hypothetical protein
MMVDFSTPEGKALFESEVRKRMEAPFYMGREQAEMMVAVLLWHPSADQESDHLAEQYTTLLRENERLTSLLVDQFDNNVKIAKLRADNHRLTALLRAVVERCGGTPGMEYAELAAARAAIEQIRDENG